MWSELFMPLKIRAILKVFWQDFNKNQIPTQFYEQPKSNNQNEIDQKPSSGHLNLLNQKKRDIMTFSFTSVFPLATKKHSLLITQFWKQTNLFILEVKTQRRN